MIYSPSSKTLNRNVFPAVQRYLYRIEVNNDDAWDNVREQLSLLASVINGAKNVIDEY